MHIRMVTKTGRPVPSYSSESTQKLYTGLWAFVMSFLTIAAAWPRNKDLATDEDTTS